MVDQICTKCYISKPLSQYHKSKANPNGVVRYCKTCVSALHKVYRKEHLALYRERSLIYNKNNREKLAERQRKNNRFLRAEAFFAYSPTKEPSCACCGMTGYDFLSLDHINNDGAAHRRTNPESKALARWARKNNYPPVIQVLCMNCNFAKGKYGFCPHKD